MKKIDYKSYEKPSNFAKFAVGRTVIRIVSSGAMAKKHSMKTSTGFIPLGNCTEQPDCEFCLKANEPKLRYMWIIIMRANGGVRLLEAGPLLGDAICLLIQERQIDPKDVDLIITKTGQGKQTKYSVGIGESTPLTQNELTFIDPARKFLIKKYFIESSESRDQVPE